MVVRSGQLRLAFSQSIPSSSKPLKMPLAHSVKRSRAPEESAFLRRMREIERVSPSCASILMEIANGMFSELLGAPLE